MDLRYDHTHHVTQGDPEEVVAYYEETLGAKRLRRWEISGRPLYDLELPGILLRVSRGVFPGVGSHVGFRTGDLMAAAQELQAHGAEFVVEPTTLDTGITLCFIKGPDGVLFEILQHA